MVMSATACRTGFVVVFDEMEVMEKMVVEVRLVYWQGNQKSQFNPSGMRQSNHRRLILGIARVAWCHPEVQRDLPFGGDLAPASADGVPLVLELAEFWGNGMVVCMQYESLVTRQSGWLGKIVHRFPAYLVENNGFLCPSSYTPEPMFPTKIC